MLTRMVLRTCSSGAEEQEELPKPTGSCVQWQSGVCYRSVWKKTRTIGMQRLDERIAIMGNVLAEIYDSVHEVLGQLWWL